MDRNRVLLIGGALVLVLILAYLFAPGRHPASVTTGGSAIAQGAITRGEEERIAENCPACGGLVECGRTKGKLTYSCFGLPPATTYIVRGNRGTLVLPDVPCRS